METEWLTLSEAARLIGCSPEKIARLVRAGKIEARVSLMDGRSKYVRREVAERLAAEARELGITARFAAIGAAGAANMHRRWHGAQPEAAAS